MFCTIETTFAPSSLPNAAIRHTDMPATSALVSRRIEHCESDVREAAYIVETGGCIGQANSIEIRPQTHIINTNHFTDVSDVINQDTERSTAQLQVLLPTPRVARILRLNGIAVVLFEFG